MVFYVQLFFWFFEAFCLGMVYVLFSFVHIFCRIHLRVLEEYTFGK